MNERKVSVADILQAVTAVVSAVTALAVAAAALNRSILELPFLPSSPLLRWLIAIVFVSLAFFLGRRVVMKPTKLLRREVFLVRPDRVDHLKGRQEDVERLFSLCRDEPSVFLVGESGAGKSALIRSGLLPRLAETPLQAVYINSWGRDWVDGPKTFIQQALAPLGVDTLEAAADAAVSQRRQLLVIFDQFDDYQSAHPSRFRSARTETILSAGELASANAFWQEVRDLLVQGHIHALFVTRADTFDGLESVRFIEPRVFRLHPLRAESAADLLESLGITTDPEHPVLSSAEHGWPELRELLVRDLSKHGSVLAVQLSLAVAGLRTLPYLTVREYERSGGLLGLEAADIEWRARNAANSAGISMNDALAILSTMVDREGKKTRVCTMAMLQAAVPHVPPNTVVGIVSEWEVQDLLRRRLASDTGGDMWSLDHDYLFKGVLEAESRANHASLLLRDAAHDHRASGRNLWRRWRTLLAPTQQIVLLRDRLRGRFRYEEKRGFALWSLLRFTPHVAVAAFAIASIVWQIDDTRIRDAADLRATIGLNNRDVDTLWTIARRPRATRRHLVTGALESVTSATQLLRGGGSALHAAVGLDIDLRQELLADLRPHFRGKETDGGIRKAAIRCALSLDQIDYDLIVAAAALPDDLAMVDEISTKQWKALAERITPIQADHLFTLLPPQLTHSYPLAILAPKLSKAGVAAAVARMEATSAHSELLRLAETLAGAALSEGEKQRVVTRLRRAMTDVNPDIGRCLVVGREFGGIPLTPDEIAAHYARIAAARAASGTLPLIQALPGFVPIATARAVLQNATKLAIALDSPNMASYPGSRIALPDPVLAVIGKIPQPTCRTSFQISTRGRHVGPSSHSFARIRSRSRRRSRSSPLHYGAGSIR